MMDTTKETLIIDADEYDTLSDPMRGIISGLMLSPRFHEWWVDWKNNDRTIFMGYSNPECLNLDGITLTVCLGVSVTGGRFRVYDLLAAVERYYKTSA